MFQVSWIRKNDVVVLSHGNLVFTSDERVKVTQSFTIQFNYNFSLSDDMFESNHYLIKSVYFQVSEKDGIWSLEIQKVGHSDQGVYECQTNTEVKTSVPIQLHVMGKK